MNASPPLDDAPRRPRPLGSTGLLVPRLGLGAGPLGDGSLSDDDAERLLEAALFAGLSLVDTAPSYGESEARLGRLLGPRRDDVVLSTKLGYGVPGLADWTAEVIPAGVEKARQRLATDVIDVVFLHSCPRGVLENRALLDALVEEKERGRVRAIGYSGENEALAFAVESGVFDVVQTSVNPVDQNAGRSLLLGAKARGMGVLAKRTLMNAVFMERERPSSPDRAIYFERLMALDFDPSPHAWDALCVRYAAFHPAVDCALVGTRSPARIGALAAALAEGPLDDETLARLAAAFSRVGADWPGVI